VKRGAISLAHLVWAFRVDIVGVAAVLMSAGVLWSALGGGCGG